MQNTETWYKAEGDCATDEFELASYLLFEAGVASLEELDPTDDGRTHFCFYANERLERDRIVQLGLISRRKIQMRSFLSWKRKPLLEQGNMIPRKAPPI